jgi:hypothetical protein
MSTTTGKETSFFDPAEMEQLLEEQRAIEKEGQKLLEDTNVLKNKMLNEDKRES